MGQPDRTIGVIAWSTGEDRLADLCDSALCLESKVVNSAGTSTYSRGRTSLLRRPAACCAVLPLTAPGWSGNKAVRLVVPNCECPWEDRRQNAPGEGSAPSMPDMAGLRGGDGATGSLDEQGRYLCRAEERKSGRINFISWADGDRRICGTS